ncbi:hypothetical protein Tsubulata_022314 [Turnera subulata]|uniref:Uncharacterized protein n=1 Tax=Turnera subulata TaxID=218843 RepID=A0A9Q0FJ35_9ROSI|nr:hypothetical protein Tsubulata_022314 [Turnera subulata]
MSYLFFAMQELQFSFSRSEEDFSSFQVTSTYVSCFGKKKTKACSMLLVL